MAFEGSGSVFHLDSDSDEEFLGFPPQDEQDDATSEDDIPLADLVDDEDEVPLAYLDCDVDSPMADLQYDDAAMDEDDTPLADGEDDIPMAHDEDHDDASDDETPLADQTPIARTLWCTPPDPLVRPVTLPDLPPMPTVVGTDLQSKTPVEFFHMVFPEELYDIIVRETNKYSEAVRDTRVLSPRSRLNEWVETNKEEIQAFLGLRIAMGLCSKSSLEDYWSKWWLTQTPNFAQVMPRNRFQLLCTFLHFVDNNDRLDREDPNYDPLFKIRPVLDVILPAWDRTMTPGKNLSIDESMVGFRGRIFFRQYIKSKHHRFGMKAFVLACGNTSYTFRWDLYTGGMYEYDHEVGQGHSVVRKLTEGLRPGHVLYLDNFYTAPGLCKELYSNGIGVCGTVLQHRRGMPHKLQDGNLKLVQEAPPVFMYKSPILACAFLDRKTVRMLSTVHSQETFVKEVTVSQKQRDKYPSGKRTVVMPSMVLDYNRFMGGVDRSDQMASYHAFPHKCVKWYMRIFSHLTEVSLINARICYNLTHDKSLSAVNFRRSVVESLLKRHVERKMSREQTVATPTEAVPSRLLGRHFMGKFDTKKPDCHVCSDRKNKHRKQTTHFCKTCPEKPALCDIPCFEIYHTQFQYK